MVTFASWAVVDRRGEQGPFPFFARIAAVRWAYKLNKRNGTLDRFTVERLK